MSDFSSEVVKSGEKFYSDKRNDPTASDDSTDGLNSLTRTLKAKRQKHQFESLYKSRQFKSLDEVPRLKEKEPPEKSMKKVNPGYPRSGTTMNCVFCTTAMVMREKGYDVAARKSKHGWPTSLAFDKAFNAPTYIMRKNMSGEDILNAFASMGDNAYGNMSVFWKRGGGHSIFWKNINGKTHVYDGQDGTEYDLSKGSKSKLMKSIKLNEIYFNRLDICEPTDYALAMLRKGH